MRGDAVQGGAVSVDLILMDYEMPRLSRPLAVEKLRSLDIVTPVAGVTGNVMKEGNVNQLVVKRLHGFNVIVILGPIQVIFLNARGKNVNTWLQNEYFMYSMVIAHGPYVADSDVVY